MKGLLRQVPLVRWLRAIGLTVLACWLLALGWVASSLESAAVAGRVAGTIGILGLVTGAGAALARVLLRRRLEQRLLESLRLGHPLPELSGLTDGLRQLVDERVALHQLQSGALQWTAARLKATLKHRLHGERVLLLANRQPYSHERADDGSITVTSSPGGLVTALEPVLRACSGVWVAHGSGPADRESSDAQGRVLVPPGESSYTLRRVWLTPEEEQGYYAGFANEGLWPLCHLADVRPIFRSQDWARYREVNERFAAAVCSEAQSSDPVILVQDYHFALAPRLIRERLPQATIISFWHIPWPYPERLSLCPWRVELLEGLLGSDIIGFQTRLHCNNFLDSAARLECRVDREDIAVVQRGRASLVRAYPISIDWPCRWAETALPVEVCRQEVWGELELPAQAVLGVGVDRLDYTKGIEERLLAVEGALERDESLRGRLVFAQLAAPSRSVLPQYRALDERVQALSERINARFGSPGYRPILLLRASHPPERVFRFYRAADFAYVSSLDDGMNLVAKEFVAARTDEAGVLILSQFAGASRELTEALAVNPYDIDAAAQAILSAVRMEPHLQALRMRALRAQVAAHNVYRWAGEMIIDAASLRERARRDAVRDGQRGIEVVSLGHVDVA